MWLLFTAAVLGFCLVDVVEMSIKEPAVYRTQSAIPVFGNIDFSDAAGRRLRVINFISIKHHDDVSICFNFARIFQVGIYRPLINALLNAS